ncbi:glycosyltransferase family 2 protein [Phaeocystidibacter luteus]|uniref:Glycosyltransferase family 2 protein n=1 Tax=Phaeocystidibacter luteus TaxID=911197 RepID=A0A6N6RF73_9FLAO|nr:glycosyltransferase family 2 protein [Phaeocystidibacter luteus]KAB2808724.1 glycosyltransferase family 2 protein [Phaeocystidibacter luteus]
MSNSAYIELSVVVPVFNEEQNLSNLHHRLKVVCESISSSYEIIFVDDGSSDATLLGLQQITDEKAFFLQLSRNFGHQIAVSAGLEYTRGEAVIIIDGDLQDPPELIPALYAKFKEGYNVVYAKRNKRKGESPFKLITAKAFYRFLNHLTSVEIPLDTGDFRLIDRRVVEYLSQMPEHNKFLRGQIAWLGMRQTEVLYDRDAREHGTTGYSFKKMLNLAVTGITGFSDQPLKLVTRLGLSISVLSFGLILYALYSHFILDETITGWTSLIFAISFFGGIQLISLGIIGEYLSRIHQNVQGRPLYIVQNSNHPKHQQQIIR